VIGDIDILVEESESHRAAAVLGDIGFAASDVPADESHHHLPMLHDHAARLTLEIHTRLELHQPDEIAPATWFRADAKRTSFGGGEVLLPSPTRLIAHNAVHSQLNHADDGDEYLQLRQLLDVAMIRARHEAAIDWSEIDRRFVAAGHGKLLANYIALAGTLFGQPMPPLSGAASPALFERLRHATDPSAQAQDEHRVVRYSLKAADMTHDGGHCWQVKLPGRFGTGNTTEAPFASTLILTEDGQPLGPAHSRHEHVRDYGHGAYSHWNGWLYFSSSDAVNPRASGRNYVATVRLPAEPVSSAED
jgi:hypothetical protein